ncbi:CCE_0567 family metalloprotein [Acidocella sp.]|uniref:CCE_0567 family metalloprotein n=1 Tax=Acidocella sp. TaxID=50710 RepID=UPI00260DE222|nr:CCE_0567 family metalloprotein [Acidocella sp.]
MSGIEAAKAELRKLSAKAMKAKMDLHDLSEELPVNWLSIMEVARCAHEAFALLEAKREVLRILEMEGAGA